MSRLSSSIESTRESSLGKSARNQKTAYQDCWWGVAQEHVTAWETATLDRAFYPSQLFSQTIHMCEAGATTVLYYHLLKSGGETGSEFQTFFGLFSTHVITISQLSGYDSEDTASF